MTVSLRAAAKYAHNMTGSAAGGPFCGKRERTDPAAPFREICPKRGVRGGKGMRRDRRAGGSAGGTME